MSRHLPYLLASLILALSIAWGCQRPDEVVPIMTQEQWRRVQSHILDEPGEVQFPIDAVFDERVRLIGWSADKSEPKAGDEITLTFYWEVLQEFDEPWKIFLHLENRTRQIADHHAIEDTYPTPYWRPGEILEDIVTLTLKETFPAGDLKFYIGLFRGEDRLPVTRAGQGRVDNGGRVNIGSLPLTWDPIRYEVRYTARAPSIDGRAEAIWRRAPRSDLFVHPTSGAAVENLDSTFQALWDEQYLYIYLKGKDTEVWATFTEHDSNLWEEEVFEVFIDHQGNGRDYIELQVNPLNTRFDARFARPTNRNLERARQYTMEGWQTAVYVDGEVNNPDVEDKSWAVEMAIPWDQLDKMQNTPPHNNDTLRINFYRYDRTTRGATRTMAWSPVGGGSFHQPDRFGEFVFVGRPNPRPEPANAEDNVEP